MGKEKQFIFYDDPYDADIGDCSCFLERADLCDCDLMAGDKCKCDKWERDRCSCNKKKRDKGKCDFKKSRLFCTSNNHDVVLEDLTDFQFKVTVATLDICQENCSTVEHDICGVLHSLVAAANNPQPITAATNLQFRIIDEFGREVCQHQVSFNFDVTPPNDAVTDKPYILNLPFCISCCDRPRACDSKVTYRLQVDSLDLAPGANLRIPVIRDVAWSAIVWEDGRKGSRK
ncbi:hypothetical protein ACFSCZ_14375 [Siminovitchia sediminis]|uniref:Uncharacterized protein n=1 Tax=Siminovitchia sediminis TaxID=1274353 RepID=A0ABW4KNV2_9BACI